jgi:hypothetical protein
MFKVLRKAFIMSGLKNRLLRANEGLRKHPKGGLLSRNNSG